MVATKADKPNRATLNAALAGMKAAFGAAPLPVSARTGDQVIALWHRIRQACRPA